MPFHRLKVYLGVSTSWVSLSCMFGSLLHNLYRSFAGTAGAVAGVVVAVVVVSIIVVATVAFAISSHKRRSRGGRHARVAVITKEDRPSGSRNETAAAEGASEDIEDLPTETTEETGSVGPVEVDLRGIPWGAASVASLRPGQLVTSSQDYRGHRGQDSPVSQTFHHTEHTPPLPNALNSLDVSPSILRHAPGPDKMHGSIAVNIASGSNSGLPSPSRHPQVCSVIPADVHVVQARHIHAESHYYAAMCV